jgi:hypothetical protein
VIFRTLLLFAACLSVVALGCGGTPVAAVHGKITLDGQPVENGSIVFLPAASGGRKAAAAVQQGSYTIPPEDQLAPGSYRVEITWQKPTCRKIPSADPGFSTDETREAIPARYNTDSTLKVDIGPGDVQQDFALTSK